MSNLDQLARFFNHTQPKNLIFIISSGGYYSGQRLLVDMPNVHLVAIKSLFEISSEKPHSIRLGMIKYLRRLYDV